VTPCLAASSRPPPRRARRAPARPRAAGPDRQHHRSYQVAECFKILTGRSTSSTELIYSTCGKHQPPHQDCAAVGKVDCRAASARSSNGSKASRVRKRGLCGRNAVQVAHAWRRAELRGDGEPPETDGRRVSFNRSCSSYREGHEFTVFLTAGRSSRGRTTSTRRGCCMRSILGIDACTIISKTRTRMEIRYNRDPETGLRNLRSWNPGRRGRGVCEASATTFRTWLRMKLGQTPEADIASHLFG